MTPERVLSGDAAWCVVEGDCRDVLRELADASVSHVITDPPYSEHVHANSRRGARANAAKGLDSFSRMTDLGFAALDDVTRDEVAGQIGRVVRRWALVFSDTESAHLWREAIEAHGLEYVRTCFWDRVASAPQFTGDRPAVACEAITVCHPARRKLWNGGGKRGIYSVTVQGGQRNEPRFHPTMKPLPLMEALVSDFTDVADVVLDPFAGSGTTGLACLNLGRRFIGIERDPTHAATARERLTAATEGSTLAARRAGQTALFAETEP